MRITFRLRQLQRPTSTTQTPIITLTATRTIPTKIKRTSQELIRRMIGTRKIGRWNISRMRSRIGSALVNISCSLLHASSLRYLSHVFPRSYPCHASPVYNNCPTLLRDRDLLFRRKLVHLRNNSATRRPQQPLDYQLLPDISHSYL